ncbi:MAG: hypothetical protein PVJ57_11435 [Phycisphaerae bacterium]|jgi:hypothetical protein
MTAQRIVGGLGLVVVLLCVGCAGAPRRAEIPTGAWSGEGTFVLQKWDAADPSGGPGNILSHGTYKTHLAIEPTKVDGQDAIRLDILSHRGEVDGLDGDRTHLVVILVKTRSLANDTIALYRTYQAGLSLDESEPSLEDAPDECTRATCLLHHGELALRIEYMDKFVDFYRFRGDTVFKDGIYGGVEAEMYVHWSERLHRR